MPTRDRKKATRAAKKKAKTSAARKPAPKPENAWGNGRWLPAPDVYAGYLDIRYGWLSELHESVENATAAKEGQLIEQFKKVQAEVSPTDEEDYDRTQYLEELADEVGGLADQVRWSSMLHAVALYHSLEAEVSALFRWRLSALTDSQKAKALRQVHRWAALEEMLHLHCNVALQDVKEYAAVNELRVVCNSVKHEGGNVSRELHELTAWSEREEIPGTKLPLKKYRKAGIAFIADLARKMERGTSDVCGKPS